MNLLKKARASSILAHYFSSIALKLMISTLKTLPLEPIVSTHAMCCILNCIVCAHLSHLNVQAAVAALSGCLTVYEKDMLMEESLGRSRVAKQRRYALEHWDEDQVQIVLGVWIQNHLRLRRSPMMPGEMVHTGKVWSLLKLLSMNRKANTPRMGNPRCFCLCQLDFMPSGCIHQPAQSATTFLGTIWCNECAVCLRCNGWAGSS